MRDIRIFEMYDTMTNKLAMVFQQLAFVQSRMQAFETIAFDKEAMKRAIDDPEWFKDTVDQIHLKLFNDHNQRIKESVEAAKEDLRKPKIQLVS